MARRLLWAFCVLLFAAPVRGEERLEKHLAKLNSPSPRARAIAFRALGEMGPEAKEAIPSLRRILLEDDPRLQALAASALVQIGEASLPVLVEAVCADVPTAADATLRFGKGCVPELLSALKADGPSAHKRRVILLLRRMGPVAAEAVPALRKQLAEEELRYHAALALVRMGAETPDAIEILVKNAQASKGGVHEWTLETLSLLGPEAAAAVPAIRSRVSKAKPHQRPGHLLAIWHIERDPDTVVQPLIDALSPEGRPDPLVAAALGRIGHEAAAALPALFDATEVLTYSGAVDEFVNAIREIRPDKKGAQRLKEWGQADDAILRQIAAYLLPQASIAQEEALPTLLKLAYDPEPYARARSLKALARLGSADPRVMQALVDALEDPTLQVYTSACQALAELGAKAGAAVPALRRALKERTPPKRRFFLQALAEIGPAAEAALPELIDALSDEDTRRWAAEALGKLGSPAKSGLPSLQEGMVSRPGPYAVACALAVWRIKGPTDGVCPLLTRAAKVRGIQLIAVRALGEIGPEGRATLPTVRGLLTTERDDIRAEAAWAVWRISGEAQLALDHLVLTVAAGRSEADTIAALNALARMGKAAEPALPFLRRTTRDLEISRRLLDTTNRVIREIAGGD